MKPGRSISILKWFDFRLFFFFSPSKRLVSKTALCIFFVCFSSPLVLSHTCTPGYAPFLSIRWQRRWIFSYICELNENKAPLLYVLCSWSFANNNVGFISCVGLKMLSWCQTTYQDAGLHMFWIFPVICLVLFGQPKTHENTIKQWNTNGVLETAVAAA